MAEILSEPKIAVIGLGYVGLPLACSLARHFTCIGFDINDIRISELKTGFDRNQETSAVEIKNPNLSFTSTLADLGSNDVFIVTVPTPINADNQPDLNNLIMASQAIAKVVNKNNIVVYESTVYPGVTEDICGKILSEYSGFIIGKDLFLGYSPERINPGDKIHGLHNITKIISGDNAYAINTLKHIYGKINNDNIFIASSIKIAEAAKVIENAQRDINVAFINEVAIILNKLGISAYEVLEAAKTKWNFLPFTPGFVGGHCIGVDPYYLAHLARSLGHEPEVILAGRKINESFGAHIADLVHAKMQSNYNIAPQKLKILILGFTFKENITDIRNTKIINFFSELNNYGYLVEIHDPLADPLMVKSEYGIDLVNLQNAGEYDCLIGAVAHIQYKQTKFTDLMKYLTPQGLIIDLKQIWPDLKNSYANYFTI